MLKQRPKQTSIPTTSSTTTFPYHLGVWIDVERGQYDKSCIEVSRKMIRLLRHDPSVLREEDGAVEFRILSQMFRSEFTSLQHRSIRAWLKYLQKEEDQKRVSSIVWIHSLLIPFYTLLPPDDFAEHIYHVGRSRETHSIIQSVLIAGGAKTSRKEDMRCSLRP